MFKHVIILFLGISGLCQPLFAANSDGDFRGERVQDFVEKNLDFARIERDQFNIPISITLAQAILESGLGESRLAREANNFFGIKCHNAWQGDTILVRDDDFDKDGNLMESCFRAYSTPAESFRDHSVFLQKPRYQQQLVGVQLDDYVSWANGLQNAGYATDTNYAQKLIDLIESFGLAQYDRPTVAAFIGPPPPPPAPPRQRSLMIQMRPEFQSFVLR